MDEFLAAVKQFGFPWPPKGWALCHGQLMPISQNQALFALLGTYFGGDGRTTFALPDLRKKDANGNYYQHAQIMENGLPYLESSICISGLFPSRN